MHHTTIRFYGRDLSYWQPRIAREVIALQDAGYFVSSVAIRTPGARDSWSGAVAVIRYEDRTA